MDKLDEIYIKQYELQKSLGNIDKMNSSKPLKQQFINQMILALVEESVEIMRETAYKNPDYVPFGWKKTQEHNNDKFKEEIIDILHFIMNLAIIAEMSPAEIHERYIGKNKVNYVRQENGY